MTSWVRRTAGLIAIAALAGSPAVRSACEVLCADGSTAAASTGDVPHAMHGAQHAAHDAAHDAASGTGHQHHAMTMVDGDEMTAPHRPSSASPGPAGRFAATCHDCDRERLGAAVATLVSGRTDTHLVKAHVVADRVAWVVAEPGAAALSSPADSPPPPSRIPSVLRI